MTQNLFYLTTEDCELILKTLAELQNAMGSHLHFDDWAVPNDKQVKKAKRLMIPPGLDPGALRVLGARSAN